MRIINLNLALAWIVFAAITTHALQGPQDQPAVQAVWGPETEGYRLSIGTDKTEYAAGETIRLFVRLQNVGREAVGVLRGMSPLRYHSFEILAPNKSRAPLTLYGVQETTNPSIRHRVGKTLMSGEVDEDVIHLNRCFDMTLAGEYSVKASTKVIARKDSQKLVTVTSLPITITVKDSPQ
jgi:hypothetical protein